MNKAPPLTLGNKIKAARKAKKLTQQRLSDKAGITVVHYSRIENDHCKPSMTLLKKLIKLLGLKDEGLLG